MHQYANPLTIALGCVTLALRDGFHSSAVAIDPAPSYANVGTCTPGAPQHDDCDFAMALPSHPTVSVPFDTTCASIDVTLAVDCPNEVPLESDLWYTYQAPCTGTVTVSTCATADFNAVIAAYDTCICVSFLDPVGCDNDSCGISEGPAEVTFAVESGGCYLIRVAGAAGASGSGILELGYDTICDATPAIPQPVFGINSPRFVDTLIPEATMEELNEVAIRVNLTNLHRVVPPYTAAPSIPFTAFEGQIRWAGPPQQYVESTTNPATLLVSQLQCEPHYQVWHDLGEFHITGSAVVPSSVFHLQTVDITCMGNEDSCTTVSAAIEFRTIRWGDVEVPTNPPTANVQPDSADISALLNKFRSAPESRSKAQLLLTGDAFGVINLSPDLDFTHISQALDAYRGSPYPFTIAPCP